MNECRSILAKPQSLFQPLMHGLLFALLFLCGVAMAQTDGSPLPTRSSIPDSVVLVVKQISEDYVVPVTGVVVGSNNRNEAIVVVPTEFVAGQEPILVLDGGADIEFDGRLAERVPVLTDSPLALITVPGLSRTPIRMTYNPPTAPHELRLAAYPPADRLAAGDLPYWIPVIVNGRSSDSLQSLADPDTLPSFTGPLFDLCEQWAGMVIAAPQSGGSGSVVLNDALIALIETLEARVQLEACEEVAVVGPVVSSSGVTDRQTSTVQSNNDIGFSSDFNDVLNQFRSQRAVMVFALAVLFSLLAFWLWSKTRARKLKESRRKRAREATTVTYSKSGMPTRVSPPSATDDEPTAFGTRPPGTTSWLRLEGTHADGRPLRGVVGVDDRSFRIEIGRAGADLSIDGPGISRKHAVITGENGIMTITDLGSRNGTFVNDVPCQKHEIFYLKHKDVLLLGAAEVHVTLAPAKGFTG